MWERTCAGTLHSDGTAYFGADLYILFGGKKIKDAVKLIDVCITCWDDTSTLIVVQQMFFNRMQGKLVKNHIRFLC